MALCVVTPSGVEEFTNMSSTLCPHNNIFNAGKDTCEKMECWENSITIKPEVTIEQQACIIVAAFSTLFFICSVINFVYAYLWWRLTAPPPPPAAPAPAPAPGPAPLPAPVRAAVLIARINDGVDAATALLEEEIIPELRVLQEEAARVIAAAPAAERPRMRRAADDFALAVAAAVALLAAALAAIKADLAGALGAIRRDDDAAPNDDA